MMKNAMVLLGVLAVSFGACAEWTGAEFVAVQVPVNEHAGDDSTRASAAF